MLMSKTPLLLLHLIGLCLSVGPVLLLDLRLAPLLTGAAVGRHDIELVRALQPFVRAGLCLLWVSGMGFLGFYALYDPAALANPKLHAKLAIVVALTVNGMLVERYVFGEMRMREGRSLFDPGDARQRLAVLTIGAVSATSWYAALVLGTVRELNFACSAWIILSFYLLALTSSLAALAAIRVLASNLPTDAPVAAFAVQPISDSTIPPEQNAIGAAP